MGHRRYILPEIDLGGGYSVAYTDGEDSMDIDVELTRLADAVNSTNRALGMPAPAISFEPGRYIVAPAGVTCTAWHHQARALVRCQRQ